MQSYLVFKHTSFSDSGLTCIWTIENSIGATLGYIKWFSQWRKYCFFTTLISEKVFDHSCLDEISEFCKEQTRLHRLRQIPTSSQEPGK